MSQRTRAHTTDAATRSPRKARPAAPTADAVITPTPKGPPEASHSTNTPSMDGETLVRTLRAVASELERDPALAQRVARAAAAALPDVAALSASATDTRAPETPATRKRSASNAAATAQLVPPTAAPEDAPEDASVPRRPARAFRPRLITGTAPDVGPGVPDPFALRAARGEAGLRAVLEDLRLGTLRAIVREHALDPSGQLVRQNDADKLRSAILDACANRT